MGLIWAVLTSPPPRPSRTQRLLRTMSPRCVVLLLVVAAAMAAAVPARAADQPLSARRLAQLQPPSTQPPLTTDTCSANQLQCSGSAGGQHRCCNAATSKCAAFADGTPRCATCQRTCQGGVGSLAFDCQNGFTCGLVDGCATCVKDTTGGGSYEQKSPPSVPRTPSTAGTMLGRQPAGTVVPTTTVATTQPAAVKTPTPAATAQATGCVPACSSSKRCVRIAPTAAGARAGAEATYRCLPRPQPAKTVAAAATGGRRMLAQ